MTAVRDATRVPDGDRFEAFVREYQDMVYGVALRLLARQADAEDVAQTVFLRAFERFDEIQAHPAVAGWLKTVTTNLCLNHLSRYRSRWRLFSELDGGEHQPFEVPDPDADITADLDQAHRAARVEQALRRLPVHQRVPLVLFHFEQQSYEEIAQLLNVSASKVKTDLHRGRLALREALS
jgi:RNA polymerase sigma-70 factor, ECF subfamily